MTIFMGHPIEYWVELNRKPEENSYENIILENARLRRRLAMFERVHKDFNRIYGQVETE